MHSDDEIRTVPSIPAQRRSGEDGAGAVEPGDAEPAGSGRGPRGPLRWVLAALLVLIVVAGIAVVIARGAQRPEALAAATPSASASPATASPAPVATGSTPLESAVYALGVQSAAANAGDEALWLSVVDPGKPALQQRYRGMFRALRALGVTRVEYTPGIPQPDKKDRSAITFPARMDYCFGADTCRGDGLLPDIQQTLTMKAVGGRWVIVAVADQPDPENPEPTPWQSGKLVSQVGRRVTVAAEPSEAGRLAEVLPLAEEAAAAVDPFARTLLAEQTRYRVYLAGEKQWQTWYGGVEDDWVVGLAVPISTYGTDVVLRMSALDSAADIQQTLQHEFGHVITISGATEDDADNLWLNEGVAEYIGAWPRPAAESDRLESVRWQLDRKRPRSMIPVDPGPRGSARAGDAFYGLSHFAVDCLAQKYGQDKMFRFVRLVLVRNEGYGVAALDAFQARFTEIDKACAAWIRRHA